MSINQPASLMVGTRVNDRYTVLAVVGRGGLGTVYRVADEWHHPPTIFALKETMDLSSGAREQFMREARWLQQLDHPNIPHVLHHFQWRDRLYLVMDYVSGENLEQKLIRNGDRPLPEGDVVAYIRPIADALAYLHSQNPPIVHRDVKPANIIVSANGQPALVDLGIAKEHLPGVRNVTVTFIRKAGTEGYSPPEQYISNGATGPWSDIYSLGATMYHLLTGRVPASAVERAALDGQLIAPRVLNPVLSSNCEAIILRALAIRPADRYASMRELVAALGDESLTKTTLIPPMTKLPSKPLCPRCGRPMAGPATLCANCASELAAKAESLLYEAPGNSVTVGFVPSAPLHNGSAVFPGPRLGPNSGPVFAPAASMVAPNPAAMPPSIPGIPTSGLAPAVQPIPPGTSHGPISQPAARKAIERPKRLSRPMSRSAVELTAAPTAPGNGQRTGKATPPRRLRFSWQLVVVAVLALTVLGGGVVFGSHAISLLMIDESTPQATGKGYLEALESHDYQKAYSYFSAHGVSQLSFDRFSAQQDTLRQQLGDITNFTFVKMISSDTSPNQVQVQFLVTRSLAPASMTYTLTVSLAGGKWQIDAVANGG